MERFTGDPPHCVACHAGRHRPSEVAESFHRIRRPTGFSAGYRGQACREMISEYRKPYNALVEYLDRLGDIRAATAGVVVQAPGPVHAAAPGAHPYLTPEHGTGP